MATAREGVHSHSPPVFEGKSISDHLTQAWYQNDVKDIGEDERKLLENYSGLKADEVLPHVLALRDKAFKIWSYACIGQMRFLAFNTRRLPFYGELVQRLKQGQTFCDAACCFGQEIRHLIYTHNLDSTQFYGFDLERPFIDMGYELFRDESRIKATFAVGDVLRDPKEIVSSSPEATIKTLRDFEGKMDVTFCSSFLHVFDWDEMVVAAVRLVSLSRPRAGSMICGKQLGSVVAGSYKMPTAHGSNYRHNEDSMRRFWEEVGNRTGTVWQVDCGLYEGLFELAQNQNHSWSDVNQRMIWWKVMREM